MIELDPRLEAHELTAVRHALGRAGIRFDSLQPASSSSAWRRAALREGVEVELRPDRYALSPRSTRGATRA